MTEDTFERHKSTRWVKAAIPSYGDDWDDAYGSDEDDASSKNVPPLPQLSQQTIPDHLISQQPESTSVPKVSPQLKQASVPSAIPGNVAQSLILSIDHFNNKEYDSEDSSDEGDVGSNFSYTADSHFEAFVPPSNLPETDSNHHIPTIEPDFNRSTVEKLEKTPVPDWNIQSPTHHQYDHVLADHDELPHEDIASLSISNNEDDEFHEIVHSDLPKQDHVIREPSTIDPVMLRNNPLSPTNLVLSIDNIQRRSYLESDSESSGNEEFVDDYQDFEPEDDYDELDQPNYHISEDYRAPLVKINSGEQLHQTTQQADTETYHALDLSSHKRNTSRTSDLDSLIEDLQNAQLDFKEDPNESQNHDYSLPHIETNDFNVSLPDYDNYESPISPEKTQPLFLSKTNSSSADPKLGNTRSLRRPPPEMINESSEIPSKSLDLRKNLMSVDYSNIAYAVSEYMDEMGYSSSGEHVDESAEHGDRLASVNEDSPDLFIQRTNSSGSLSTGNFSLVNSVVTHESASEKFKSSSSLPDRGVGAGDGLGRRDTTMSSMTTTTLNFGGWQPNTNSFRDQFINDNDNESSIGFDTYDQSSGYEKFTKGNIPEESLSERSSLSIPETIEVANDAELPDIDTDKEEFPEDSPNTSNHDESIIPSLDPLKRGSTSDSLDISRDIPETPKTQRYSSLLSPSVIEEEGIHSSVELSPDNSFITAVGSTTPSTRNFSYSSTTPDVEKRSSTGSSDAASQAKTLAMQNYPVSNWKNIMAKSQPIDRIIMLREALEKEKEYDAGLSAWINSALKKNDESSPKMNIGVLATQAYKNATTTDIRRGHSTSIRSKVSSVREIVGVGDSAFHSASSLGKRLFKGGRKLMRSSE